MNIEDKSWHVMSKTRNGTVSLVRNLSLYDAAQVYEKLDPFLGMTNGWRMCQDSDVEQREVLGPAEWDGCKKAMQHQYNLTEYICDGGPNLGRPARHGTCSLCGAYSFVWLDLAKDLD